MVIHYSITLYNEQGQNFRQFRHETVNIMYFRPNQDFFSYSDQVTLLSKPNQEGTSVLLNADHCCAINPPFIESAGTVNDYTEKSGFSYLFISV